MTITMEQLVGFYRGGEIFSNKTLPLKGAFKLNRIKKEAEKDFTFYQEKFKEILEKYAQKDENGEIKFSEDGQQIMIQEGQIAVCSKELQELEQMEVEIDTYDLTIEDLGDIDCTPDELQVLMPFFS